MWCKNSIVDFLRLMLSIQFECQCGMEKWWGHKRAEPTRKSMNDPCGELINYIFFSFCFWHLHYLFSLALFWWDSYIRCIFGLQICKRGLPSNNDVSAKEIIVIYYLRILFPCKSQRKQKKRERRKKYLYFTSKSSVTIEITQNNVGAKEKKN